MNPINMLPVSPIYILAGWKLYLRKPIRLPVKAMVKTAIKGLPFIRATIKRIKVAIAAILQKARPLHL